ncbi:putative membrane protein YhhN [Microbacterium halimionae]|uniref:Putative membrane protein YhhN n=1 Tax=Microbacterium halimionae TaxID=1526413 RepID=A0A7W3JP14_9MICO|nr:lysoplasmalogenase [Microbacterium halimionae]MBA8816382.1 putative membrane protein YhhN [Microbacterium halimionae]NII96583.1 putative membrane protein YhhN [Microbacterium halimionae]
MTLSTPLARNWWWGFIPYIALSIIHVVTLALSVDDVAGPTKLWLMPLLIVAVLWGGRGTAWGTPYTLLFLALAFSWLGDGAGTFFPYLDDELPAMLLCFGVAHLIYIALFWRYLAITRVPRWAAIYAVWWIVLVVYLWPYLGGLAFAVAAYGLVLGGTAVLSTRCHPAIAWGGAFFLTSDTILAFTIFAPKALPPGVGDLVMLTYTMGQGLIAAGVIIATHRPRSTASVRHDNPQSDTIDS